MSKVRKIVVRLGPMDELTTTIGALLEIRVFSGSFLAGFLITVNSFVAVFGASLMLSCLYGLGCRDKRRQTNTLSCHQFVNTIHRHHLLIFHHVLQYFLHVVPNNSDV